jgi:hypothetical protein
MFSRTAHVFAEVLAASHYAAMANVSSHTFAGFAHLGSTLLHLTRGGVVILLSKPIQRGQA